MKKITQILFAVVVLANFYACNGSNSKSEKENSTTDNTGLNVSGNFPWVINTLDSICLEGRGMGNFIISSNTADSMINHFNTVYGNYSNGNRIDALKREYWIDSCTIFAISSFLKSSGIFDGIRIHFGASTINDPRYSAPYQNQSSIFIYPTTKSQKGHKDSLEILIPKHSLCTTSSPYIESYATAGNKISVFERIYHQNSPAPADSQNYSLSKGVWVDACVIYYMENLIRSSDSTLDGIRIYTAAYLGNETRLPRGAKAKQASTIIMVPTTPDGANHKDNWDIIKEIIIQLKNKYKIMGAGLNHGELCPQQCE